MYKFDLAGLTGNTVPKDPFRPLSLPDGLVIHPIASTLERP